MRVELSHDIILSCDFLTENVAIINYVHAQVLFSVMPNYGDDSAPKSHKLSVEIDIIIPPTSTVLYRY